MSSSTSPGAPSSTQASSKSSVHPKIMKNPLKSDWCWPLNLIWVKLPTTLSSSSSTSGTPPSVDLLGPDGTLTLFFDDEREKQEWVAVLVSSVLSFLKKMEIPAEGTGTF